MGLIYKVTNTINNKSYIGQTRLSLSRRRTGHKAECLQGKTSALYNAARKYGWDSFEWTVLEDNIPIERLNTKEVYYIQLFDSYKTGYNCTTGGNASTKISEESRLKMSISSTGKRASPETKAKLSRMRKGRKLSPEHIRKAAEGLAADWEITKPNGDTIIIKNLNEFCRQNQLTCSAMIHVSQGRRLHHKQYKCIKINKT